MTYFELSPHNGQKSYYGKAIVWVHRQEYTLRSYATDVATFSYGGGFHLICGEDDLSRTTMKHINSFRVLFDLPTITVGQARGMLQNAVSN